MKYILALSLLFMGGCISMADRTVYRSEWLACCKMCDKPIFMDYVTTNVLTPSWIECHCTNGKTFTLKSGYSH